MGKRNILLAASAAFAIAAASTAAQAVILLPGQTNQSPDVFPALSGVTLVASTSGTLTSVVPNDFIGRYSEWVYKNPADIFGAGDLTWIIRVSSNSTSINDIEHVTASSFAGFSTDVGYIGGSGGAAPEFVDRTTAAVISFDFKAPGNLLSPGSTSSLLEIQTNATSWNYGFISAINAGTATAAGFAPDAPEPSTWAMMLMGFAGLGFAGFRARRESISIA